MRCPKCGYVSFDHLEACKRCGADLQEGTRRRGRLGALSAAQESAGIAGVHLPAAMLGSLSPAIESLSPPVVTLTDALPSAPADALPKAGMWIRMAAWIVDVLCLFLMTIVLAFVVLTTIWFGGWLGGEINDQVMALAGYSGALIVMASGFAYFTLFVGSTGRTPGKMLFGLKIVRMTGEEMSYARASIRSLGWILSLLLFSVGFLMIAFTRQKQGLHDMLAGCYVLRLRPRL